MDPHDGMLRPDRLPPHKLAVAAGLLRLLEAAVLGAQALEQGPDRLAQAGVGGGLAGPGGVPARRQDGEQGEDGDTGRLALVRDVGVEARGGEAAQGGPVAVLVVGAEVDVVEL